VLGAAHQYLLLGPLSVLVLLGLHFYFLPGYSPVQEFRLLITAGVLGFVLDSLQAFFGVFSFAHTTPGTWVSPFWMTTLWVAFATTLHTSLRWLSGRYALAAALGVIGGPLSYYSGAQLGALTLNPDLTLSFLIMAIAWGIAMPILVWLAKQEAGKGESLPMNKQAKAVGISIFFLCPLFGINTNAATIEGVTFADRYQAGTTTLTLNNVGLLRYRVVFKGYVAALYLGEGVRPEDVLTDVPKRLELEYFWSIAGTDFGKAAEKILADNFPASQINTFRSRLDRLNTLYENVKPGDRYSLTYLPGVGTELALNGEAKGVIEGSDFAAAYFAIWLGAKPLDSSLKTQLLTPQR
jgi:hypothetical protein